jgi:signal transduction histidine kinase
MISILLVDDKILNLEALEELLASPGYNLIKADSGPKALKRLLVDPDRVALIILDVQMPTMDGFETAKLIQQRDKTKNIPIIFISAEKIERKDIFQGYALGAFDYMTKPFDPEMLKSKVTVFVNLYRLRDKLRTANEQLQQEIIERRQAEKQVISLNANLEKRTTALMSSNEKLQQFAYVASHDLQEPLRMVTNYIQLFEKRYKNQLDEKADKYIHYAVDGAQRMQNLVSDLLAFSRIESQVKEFEPVDCTDLLLQVLGGLKLLIEENHAEITHNHLPTVLGDEMQLGQLFQNLIDNAIKYRKEEPPQIHISAEQKGKEWVFTVSDNGIGIDPKHFDRIFVIFKRLHVRDKYCGTGIGLAVCDRIVNRHGGKIWVESKPGKGSRFFFTMPAIKAF